MTIVLKVVDTSPVVAVILDDRRSWSWRQDQTERLSYRANRVVRGKLQMKTEKVEQRSSGDCRERNDFSVRYLPPSLELLGELSQLIRGAGGTGTDDGEPGDLDFS